jgi:predicted transcriptional regulator of viral defense system
MESLKKLQKLKRQTFSTADARRVGISPRMLTYLFQKGAIERRAQGLYCFANQAEELDLKEIIQEMLLVVPVAIVGLGTALQLFNLSDEPTREIDLIVPQNKGPSRKLKNAKFFRVRMPLSKFKTQKIDGIRVTTLEQTMVDLLRAGYSISELVRIFNLAQKKRMPVELSQLKKLGDIFRVKTKVARFIEAVD